MFVSADISSSRAVKQQNVTTQSNIYSDRNRSYIPATTLYKACSPKRRVLTRCSSGQIASAATCYTKNIKSLLLNVKSFPCFFYFTVQMKSLSCVITILETRNISLDTVSTIMNSNLNSVRFFLLTVCFLHFTLNFSSADAVYNPA
jgi:hypothetical protein